MKNISKILLLSVFGLMTLNQSIFSQGGLAGQPYDFEQRWLCDSTPNRTFYRLDVHRPGQSAVTIGNYLPDGSSYTVTSSIKPGPCATPSGFPDSSFSYFAVEACDWVTGSGGVSYFILMRVATHNTTFAMTRSYIGTFNAQTGASYTVTGSYQDGFCTGWADKVVTNMQHTIATNTTGSITTTNAKHSVEIMNIGTFKGTVTVNSTAIDLYPGMKWFCYSQIDPVSNELLNCPTVTYDCVTNGNTTYLIVRKGD